MLRELLPKYLAVALLIASVFPAALVVQAGLAIDLFIQRTRPTRTLLVRAYRVINGVIALGALLYLLLAAVGALTAARRAMIKPPAMTVPEGWPAAPP